jgi:phosphoribosylglycinamide formyltransferase-1
VPKQKIAVLASGGGSNLQALIDAVEEGALKGQLELVVADRRDAYALERARSHGIPARLIDRKACKDKKDFDGQLLDCLHALKPDLIVLAGYLSIISRELVKEYQGKIINIHPSLIPSFCGKGFYGERVHQAAIDYGVKLSGATVHFVDENTDTGPIILQEAVPVLPSDDAKALGERVLEIEHRLLVKAVALYCDHKIKIEGRKVSML